MQLQLQWPSTDLNEKESTQATLPPLRSQLLKWIGNKQKFAAEIVSYFPVNYSVYHEPFLGSGAVLGFFAPSRARASDSFAPLMDIWAALKDDPSLLKSWYQSHWETWSKSDRVSYYDFVKSRFNTSKSGADFLFLSRTAYGGVIRFRKSDGHMSTPCGAHDPIHFEKFGRRVDEWHRRVKGCDFAQQDYQTAFEHVKENDIVYCDPPYDHSQAILYGAQGFDYDDFFKNIERLKNRGAFVALSLNKTKTTDGRAVTYQVPSGLFAREVNVNCGKSMLKRFQMEGEKMDAQIVTDSLYLTH